MMRSRLALPLLTLCATAAAQTCGSWRAAPTPLPAGSTAVAVLGVHARTADDAWAVGYARQGSGTFSYAIRWDGVRWQQVPTPSPEVYPGRRYCELYAVHAFAADDAWAAGTYERTFPNNSHIGPQIFLLHWDGGSWQQVPEPLPRFTYMASSSGTRVEDIVAFGPRDMWMYGYWPGDELSPRGPLALHWDGSSFRRLDTGILGQWTFEDADASGPGDVWAVLGSLPDGGHYNPRAAQWNGSSWAMHALPSQPVHYYDLEAVEVIGPADVWVTGSERDLINAITRPYAVHWDGRSWTRRDSNRIVTALLSFAGNEVYGFGSAVERWDGSAWSVVEPLASRRMAFPRDASAAPGTACSVWAAGTQWIDDNAFFTPLLLGAGDAGSGTASIRPPCAAQVALDGLLASTTPRIGQPLVVGMDDAARRTGLAPGATWAVWLLGAAPAPGYPCGLRLPGFGTGGGPGELMLDPRAPLAVGGASTWAASGTPVWHRLDLPMVLGLIGRRLYSQGAMVGSGRVVLSAGLDLEIGRF